MKSKMKLAFIFNCLLLCSATFAEPIVFFATPVHISRSTNQISCPQKIVCGQDKKISSCKVVGGDTAYWDISHMHETENEVAKGTYIFSQAVSSSQAEQNTTSTCFYSDNTHKGFLVMNSQEGANLEVLSATMGKWAVDKHYALCTQATSEKDCPLAEKPELMIDKHVIVGKMSPFYVFVKASSYGGSIPDDKNMNNRYFSINHDKAAVLASCSKMQECSLDITLQVYETTLDNETILKDYKVGSVVVDMSNNMKILKVKPILKDGFEMKQQKPFNTIQFIKK